MNKYHTVKQLGDGSFGSVIEARNKDSNEKVRLFTDFWLL
jgi:serine/threonine protein kinase